MKLDALINAQDHAAQFMIDDITKVCTTMPKRNPGSEGEKIACEYFEKLCLEEYGCDEAHVESFEEHPWSFFGWMWITFTMTIIAAILVIIQKPVLAVIAIVLTVLGWALCITQFGLYWKVVDFIFPKETGHSMWAVKKPKGEVKQRVLFNGHVDAVWEWPANYLGGGVLFEGLIVVAAIGTLYYLALAIMILAGVSAALIHTMALWGIIFIPFEIYMFFMWSWWGDPTGKTKPSHIVDGANDNLSGCYIGLAILKELKEQGIDLEHTEVGVMLAGSEEAGLRGSLAWAEKHQHDFDDVPTYIYSYDTIFDPKYLMANYRDLNGTTKTDKGLNDLFMQSAEELGIHCIHGWVPPLGGATDTAAFTKYGFRCGGVTGLNHNLQNYYHTRRDTYDNMNKQGLGECYAVSVKCLEHIENQDWEGK